MDFSIPGSDSWETTASQEIFIASYFTEQKLPVSSKKRNKRKRSHDVNPKTDEQPCRKKQALSIKKISPQASKVDIKAELSQCSSKKKQKKQMRDMLEFTEKVHEDSERSLMNGNFTFTEIELPQKPVNNHLISPIKNKRLKKKFKKASSQETEPNLLEQTVLPQKSKVKKKKVKKRKDDNLVSSQDHEDSINTDAQCTKTELLQKPQSLKKHLVSPTKSILKERLEKTTKIKKKKVKQNLKQTSESQSSLLDSEGNSKETFQESDEELVEEIKRSDVFKEIEELLTQAPFLRNLKDSDESFGELSDEDLDESGELSAEDLDESGELSAEGLDESGELSAEDSDESSPEVANSVLLKGAKNTKLSTFDNQNSNAEVKNSNRNDKKRLLDQSLNVGLSCKLQNNELIQNPGDTKKNKARLSLKSRAQEKLQAAKFRYLNEKFYTETGENVFQYFQENTEEYHDYHQGYSLQVSKWPMNPVSKIISDLQNMKKNSVVADMGCGDAKIAQTLKKLKVHSFDIVALNDFVTPCDISKVPLPKESVDAVVFCLSLMGTNLTDYLLEAHRILKLGGTLKIAEVESRITDVKVFIKGLECCGFSLQKKDMKHKVFLFLDLKKKKKSKNTKIPKITLRPCLYKKR